jgi:nitrite reductase/ring-hydroxylating ferredoxin subunit
MARKQKLEPEWVDVGALERLRSHGRALVRTNGHAIAVFEAKGVLYACANRCPHEGYPLMEGDLSGDCVLTCNWHNWKFDLKTGVTVIGGDRLRTYPVERRDGAIWIDVAEEPVEARIARGYENLHQAMDDFDYDRMAREIARLDKLGVAGQWIVAAGIALVHDRFEHGGNHAFAAADEWLRLSRRTRSKVKSLGAILEAIAHMSYDAKFEGSFPFTRGLAVYAPEALMTGIEEGDESHAIAVLHDALAEHVLVDGLLDLLDRAALAHYQDFGHAAIYTDKVRNLIAALGPAVEEPLLLWLVRTLCYSTREDLIPEFRPYGEALAKWDDKGDAPVAAADFHGLSVREACKRTLKSSGRTEELFDALLGAAAWNLLHFDLTFDTAVKAPVGEGVGWLDFTHGITFANAVRHICARQPTLWPQGLLQMACFVGRNKRYVDPAVKASKWRIKDAGAFFEAETEALYDHGIWRGILAVHRAKTLAAAEDLMAANPKAPYRGVLLAGVNRFLKSDIKGKHVLRTMNQALDFIAKA